MRATYFTKQEQQDVAPEDIRQVLLSDEGALWVDITISDEDDMALLKQIFEPHPLTLEDLYHQQQRPKVEEFTDHLFIILNPFVSLSSESMFRELSLFVGKNYVVTAHMADEPLIDEIRRRLEPGRSGLSMSATHLLYIVFDTVLDGYLPALEVIETRMEALGTEVLQRPDPEILTQIFELQRQTNQFWWVVWPQQDISNTITNHDIVFTDQKSLYYLRDISDHLARIRSSLQVDRDALTSLIQIYISSTSNRLNVSVRRLTMLTIGVGIFAVFSGFYGMNFERTWPPFDAPWGVPVVLLMMVMTALVALTVLSRSR